VKLGAIISKMACINVSADEISDIIKDVSNGNLTTLLLLFFLKSWIMGPQAI